GGNVGISTAAPAYTLDVQGDINFNGRLLKGGNEVSLGGPQWSAASGSGIYYTGGKVGIGTASPNSNSVLTIADSAYPALSLKDAGTGDYGQLAAVLSNGYYSAFAAKNDVVLRSNAGSLILTASNIMGDVKIGTKFGGNSESVKMIVKSDGKVGVGTMDPGQKLEVNGSVYVNAETSGFIVDAAGNKRVGLMKYQGTEGALTHGNTTALRFGQVNQASVTGGSFTEQMRIDNSGNVGINTTDPKSKLSIIAPNTSASNGEDSPHGLIIGSGTTPSSDYYLYMGADRSRGYSYIQSVGANYYRSLVLQGRGGTVAIGDPASASAYTDFKLWVGGKAYGNEWKTPSDARWKKNVAPLKNSLQKVVQLRGVNYDWRVKEFPKKGFAEGKQAGLIAQEVEKVIPEIVSTDSAGYKSLAYDRLTAYLVEAVKELKAENDGLKARLAALEGKSK
ncbi:MAG: tail fiber domain-containing protein, partial [Candidatus Saganbacteria bacterium]|nr:tail fiber domain-containing protein [Candidatus Saganbacteria bacterium]